MGRVKNMQLELLYINGLHSSSCVPSSIIVFDNRECVNGY